MKCERCGKEPTGYNIHDYCASCSRYLCDACMADGCCGAKPAKSGLDAEYDYADLPPLSAKELDDGAHAAEQATVRAARQKRR